MSNRGDVFAAYQKYLDAFMAIDEHAIRECVQWPCTFLGADSAVVSNEFPYSPTDLKRQKGWAASIGLEVDIVAVTDNKAHVLLRNCERVRPDGRLLEEVSAFYAFTKTVNGWKIFAMSSIEFSATAIQPHANEHPGQPQKARS